MDVFRVDATDKEELNVWVAKNKGYFAAVSPSMEGLCLSAVDLLHADKAILLVEIPQLPSAITDCVFSEDGSRLALAFEENLAMTFDLQANTHRNIPVLQPNFGDICFCDYLSGNLFIRVCQNGWSVLKASEQGTHFKYFLKLSKHCSLMKPECYGSHLLIETSSDIEAWDVLTGIRDFCTPNRSGGISDIYPNFTRGVYYILTGSVVKMVDISNGEVLKFTSLTLWGDLSFDNVSNMELAIKCYDPPAIEVHQAASLQRIRRITKTDYRELTLVMGSTKLLASKSSTFHELFNLDIGFRALLFLRHVGQDKLVSKLPFSCFRELSEFYDHHYCVDKLDCEVHPFK